MLLLITFIVVALGFSFLCSVAEAVLLSVTPAYIRLKEKKKQPSGQILKRLTVDIHKPLAAILTLNTIAHTIGAAGAGAQAAVVFGNEAVGIVSAILTLLILVFSEIIPKTLGAVHWRTLAPATAYGLKWLIWLLYPFVKMSEYLAKGMSRGPVLSGFSREEFAAMAEVSAREGDLEQAESTILSNLMALRKIHIKDAMTPRVVMQSFSEKMPIADFVQQSANIPFSRLPVYSGEHENITGFVLKAEILNAHIEDKSDRPLKALRRELPAMLSTASLSQAFTEFQRLHTQIILAVDEYGGVDGILTLEDLFETILGIEITDESDQAEDMQKLARRLWKRRAQQRGVNLDQGQDE